jgi:mRNA interferase RelE/StbE
MWTIEFSKKAEKQFKKLDNTVQTRIKKAVLERLVINPNLALLPLTGDKVGLYKFRVGDYRLLCSKYDEELYILVVKVKHRRDIYKN